MEIPFTITQFMDVFAAYNRAIGPAPLVLGVMALAAAWLSVAGTPIRNRLVAAILTVLWLWTGLVYHIAFFAQLNPPAYAFGGLFVLQSLVFLWTGVWRGRLQFAPRKDGRGVVGGLLMLYGLAVYPLLGLAFGHTYPEMPTFGAPCPTTIFTIGLLFWLRTPVPRHVFVMPVIWSVIGGSAAFSLGVTEDYGLVIAGLAALALAVVDSIRRHHPAGPAPMA